jgi:hypothetical protein
MGIGVNAIQLVGKDPGSDSPLETVWRLRIIKLMIKCLKISNSGDGYHAA